MYARNHYFGLGPITKPKPELADIFGDMLTDAETTFQRENLDTDSIGYFSIKKGPLKPNLLQNLKYFQIVFEVLGLFSSFFKKTHIQQQWET